MPPTIESTLRSPFLLQVRPEHFAFSLGSDNHSGVHPRFLAAIEQVNQGFAPSYGTDLVTDEAKRLFQLHFGENAEAHFCFNGTAANVLGLSALVRSHHAILASEHAHLLVDECAAPERAIGCKMISVPSIDAKLRPDQLEPYLIRKGDQHFSQVRAVSITQPTELGTSYSLEEIQALSQFCKDNGLWLHIDGSRFANAVFVNGTTMREMATGADVLSFGGTKNGMIFGEAVLFLSERARQAALDFKFQRKQLMQLPSKTRLIAAQFVEYLGTDLWREIASHSCTMASRLAEAMRAIEGVTITQAVQSNAVFAVLPRSIEKGLREVAFFYVWNERTREVRLMTSWNTSPEAINHFTAKAHDLADSGRQQIGDRQ